MKSVVLSCLVFAACVGIALGVYDTCAVMDTDYKLWDVTSSTYNDTDTYGIVSVNLCVDQERSCSHSTNQACSACQFIFDQTPQSHSYCIGYNKDEVYSPLSGSYEGRLGFNVKMTGDTDYCPGGIARTTIVNVICNEGATRLAFINEDPVCTYNFELYNSGRCQVGVNSFTPSFTVTSLTPNSIEVLIDDTYNFMFWTYIITLNGKTAYTGFDRRVKIDNLDAGTTYQVLVSTQSGQGAVINMISSSPVRVVQTLPDNIGSPHTAVVDGRGTGILIGMIIAAAIGGALFGLYKFTKTDFFQEKFGGGGGKSKGFSLMDAEKSNAFE